jgi:asparagine synthase (glutamine-hydrolysing)
VIRGTLGAAGVSCVAATTAARGPVQCFLEGDPSYGAPELAEAFPRLREHVLDDLRGRFVLVLWDSDAEEGLVAVDQLASRPLFYREAGAELRFAGELRDLLVELQATPSPALPAVARWLEQGALLPGETLYEGVHRLPGGHCLHLERGRWTRRRYWRARYEPPLTIGREDAVVLVREGIVQAVTRRAPGRAGVLLSGGLDSTSIASIVRGAPDVEGLTAYSATFPDHPETDESDAIRTSTTELSLPWRPVAERSGTVLEATLEHTREWRVPPAAPTLFFQAPVIRAAADDGIRVLLDGQGGDELFGCSAYLIADAVRRLRFRTARELAVSLPGFGPSPAPELVRRAMRTFGVGGAAPWLVHRARLAVRTRREDGHGLLRPGLARVAAVDRLRWEWTRLDGPRWWAALADELTRGRELYLVHEYLRRKFASAGIVGAHPFLDDLELIELVLRLPPALSFHPTVDRPLLRDAVRGLVPETIRTREDKARFDAPVMESIAGPDAAVVRELLEPRDARVRRWVSDDALSRLLDVRPGQTGSRWARVVWRLASTEQWLRLLEDSVSVRRTAEA